jgi:hypothetical membrane protein
MVGLFTEDGKIALHRIGAVDHFILGNLSMVLLGYDLWKGGGRSVLAVCSILFGLVGLLATLLFVQGQYLGMGIGGMERLAAYPVPVWMIVIGLSLAVQSDRVV